jgi:hypothetical protein
VDDIACHVGQPKVSAHVLVSQLLVVESKQMQDRGV